MTELLPLGRIDPADTRRFGGKATALARLHREGFNVPPALCIGTDGYREFVTTTGLSDRLFYELNRKAFEEMRWEEIWDLALRIRNDFLKTELPAATADPWRQALRETFSDTAVAVRSSGIGEDSARTSFAGLHDSFVNLRGPDETLRAVRLVWASLWSDRALLYRKELGLEIRRSAMGVVIQEMAAGEVSGVAFSRNPMDPDQAVIEAVHGLNQGLVDGDVAPDRWHLMRDSGKIVRHLPADRSHWMTPSESGAALTPLPRKLAGQPPLDDACVARVHELAMSLESLFDRPQDVEWTFRDGRLFLLQSRPVTLETAAGEPDAREWYLKQHQGLGRLQTLCDQVEKQRLPEMTRVADQLAEEPVESLDDAALAGCISDRETVYRHWKKIYWDEFIPLAHGIRLFGQVYTDRVAPENPFEFQDLLSGTDMLSLKRNERLAAMADHLRNHPDTVRQLAEDAGYDGDPELEALLHGFMETFGDAAWQDDRVQQRPKLIRMLRRLSEKPVSAPRKKDPEALKDRFLAAFPASRRDEALALLDLGRRSYRLRDDDNLYLGRIEGQWLRAAGEGRSRLARRGVPEAEALTPEQVAALLRDPDAAPPPRKAEAPEDHPSVQARQMVGQPAGPGVATAEARVILNASDLWEFRPGEMLVCDAVDPNMTFVVPLCAGIVERRGGMLIHGAIIAREYGLPCVTGVPDAARNIRTGDRITVDGWLGIVINHAH